MTDYLTIRSNTRINAVTQYRNFDFNSMAVFNGEIIGVNDSGVFRHTGDKDDGVDIDAYFIPLLTDFGSSLQKRVRAVHIGYQSDDRIKFTVTDDEDNSRSYTLERIADSKQTGNRQYVGRDGKGRYWRFKIENVNGADFTIDNMEVMLTVLTHRKTSGRQLFWTNLLNKALPATTCSGLLVRNYLRADLPAMTCSATASAA